MRKPTVVRSVRGRVTLATTAVFAVATAVGAVVFVHFARAQATESVHRETSEHLASVLEDLSAGTPVQALPLDLDDRGRLIQVHDGDRIVAASPGWVLWEQDRGELQIHTASDVPAPRDAVTGLFDPDELPAGWLIVEQAGTRGLERVLAAVPLDQPQQTAQLLAGTAWVAVPVLIIVVGMLTWAATGSALRPVVSIGRRAASISALSPDARVPVPDTADEVEALAHTVNEMLARLDSSAARQQQFVADAAHELRTPLATMRTNLEVALLGQPTWRRRVGVALTHQRRLEALIDDLLALARLDEDAPLPSPQEIDLVGVLRDAAADDGATVIDGDAAAVITGHRELVRRLVDNVLANAARHRRTTTHINVHGRTDGVHLHVDDDGPGIPEADRDRAFTRFTRLHDSSDAGSGIGLALCAAIARAHSAAITVEDAPIGGARIHVVFPPPKPRHRPG